MRATYRANIIMYDLISVIIFGWIVLQFIKFAILRNVYKSKISKPEGNVPGDEP
jgi:hypothetical protein